MNKKFLIVTSDITAFLTMISIIPYDKDSMSIINQIVPPNWIPWIIKAGIASTLILRLMNRFTAPTPPALPIATGSKLFTIIAFFALSGMAIAGPVEPVTPLPTPSPTPGWVNFVQGASDAKTLSIEVHPIYATGLPIGPNGKKENPWGGGAGAAYPIGDFVYAYAGISWFGGQWLGVTGQIGLHADINFGPITVTPIVGAGSYTPVTGAGSSNGSTGALLFAGGKIKVWASQDKRYQFEILGTYGHDTALSGTSFITIGPVFTAHF